MGNGFRLPLFLTEEMQQGLIDLSSKTHTTGTFALALKVMRAGFIQYGVLSNKQLQAMYQRKLILDEEVEFMLKTKLVSEDFRPVKIERLHQANEIRMLDKYFIDVIDCWKELKPKSKARHIKNASKYPDLASAKRLLEVAVNG